MPANNIEEAWKALRIEPLKINDSRYMDCSKARRISVVNQLYYSLMLNSDEKEPMHIIFTGYRGDGKTTELNKLIDKVKDSHLTMYFSAEKVFHLSDFRFTDFLLGISKAVYDRLNEENIKIPNKLLKKISDWFVEIVEVIEVKRMVETQAKIGANIPEWFSFLTASLVATIKAGGEKKKEIRKKVNQDLPELINLVDLLLQEASKLSLDKDGRDILIICDNLDRLQLDLAKDLFYTNGQNLCYLKCNFIYVIPSALLYENGARNYEFHDKVEMQIIPIRDRNNLAIEENINYLTELLKKRFIPDYIMEDSNNILRNYILASGGHLRDLVRLIRDSCLSGCSKSNKKIDENIMKCSINKSCESLHKMLKDDDLSYLVNVYNTKEAGDYIRKKDLIFETIILQYYEQDGETWYDVHPVIVQGSRFQKILAGV